MFQFSCNFDLLHFNFDYVRPNQSCDFLGEKSKCIHMANYRIRTQNRILGQIPPQIVPDAGERARELPPKKCGTFGPLRILRSLGF